MISASSSRVCASGWTQYNNNCYRLTPKRADYYSIVLSCDQIGGYLVTINDNDENDFLYTAFTAASNNPLWIGLSDFKKKLDAIFIFVHLISFFCF